MTDILTRISKENFLEYFYDELVELLMDEDLMVRLEAVEAIVEIMPTKLNAELIDKDIMPEILNLLDNEHDDECN